MYDKKSVLIAKLAEATAARNTIANGSRSSELTGSHPEILRDQDELLYLLGRHIAKLTVAIKEL